MYGVLTPIQIIVAPRTVGAGYFALNGGRIEDLQAT